MEARRPFIWSTKPLRPWRIQKPVKRYDTHRVTSNASASEAEGEAKEEAGTASREACKQHQSRSTQVRRQALRSHPRMHRRMFSHDKLLTKALRTHEGTPTREVRSDIIQKEFTQKQRVLFEKWIVTQREAESERETQQAASMRRSLQMTIQKQAADRSYHSIPGRPLMHLASTRTDNCCKFQHFESDSCTTQVLEKEETEGRSERCM